MRFWFFIITAVIIYFFIKGKDEQLSHLSEEVTFSKKNENSPATPINISQTKQLTIAEKLSVNLQQPKNLNSIERRIIDLFNNKKFLQALSYAEKNLAAKSTPMRTINWIKKQHPTLLLSVGFYYLKKNNCEKSLTYLTQSHELKPTPNTTKGLIFCNKLLGSYAQAQSLLFFAVNQKYYDIELLRLHKDVMETLQKLGETEQYYLQAITYFETTNDENIVKELKKDLEKINSKKIESDSQEWLRSNNFYIKFNKSINQSFSNSILDYLELALTNLSQKYPFYLPKAPIEVVLYNYTSFLNNNGSAPTWAEGIYDGRLRIPIRDSSSENNKLSKNLKKILKHELVHALISEIKKGRYFPTWLEEGLAQALSCAPSCSPIRGSVSESTFLSIKKLDSPFIKLDRKSAIRAYSNSLFIIYYIEQEYENDFYSRVIEAILQLSELSSNSILNFTTGTDFNTVYQRARERWFNNELLYPRASQ